MKTGIQAAVIVAVCLLHLAFSAVTILRSNQDFRASDQGAEMWLAELSRGDLYPQRTDGVRHPLFSWCAQRFFTADKDAFFARGKWFNTIVTTLFLACLGGMVARWLDPLALANLLLLSSLGGLLVRGTYFQPEPLYYVLFFCCCVLGWEILRGRRGPLWYPVFGILCGAAFLAKPSLSPFLGAFAVGVGARFVAGGFRLPSDLKRVVPGALAGIVLFLAMIVPLGLYSREYFGKPFFNFPQVWMWMDYFDTEAWPWQDRHPGRKQLENLAPGEVPSPAWYFRRHSVTDAFNRLTTGAREVAVRFLFPEPKRPVAGIFWRPRGEGKKWEHPILHRGIYLLVLAGLVVGLMVMAPGVIAGRLEEPGFWGAAAFLCAGMGAYVMLYGWYWPIGRGDRFMGSLWIPCVFLAVYAGRVLVNAADSRPARGVYYGVHGAVLLALLIQCVSTSAFFLAGGALTTRN